MAGGALKYRHLNRHSAHRQALLRNLVTSLFTHESIQTTWPKAKEAQRLAEKVITYGKKGTLMARRKVEGIFYNVHQLGLLPKLFNDLAARYRHRPGGYTRVLRIEPIKEDQAPSAILELVDGPKDMRFYMTAKTLVREREREGGMSDMTVRNVNKVTRFRENGQEELEAAVRKLEGGGERGEEWRAKVERRKRVYHIDKENPFEERNRKKWED